MNARQLDEPELEEHGPDRDEHRRSPPRARRPMRCRGRTGRRAGCAGCPGTSSPRRPARARRSSPTGPAAGAGRRRSSRPPASTSRRSRARAGGGRGSRRCRPARRRPSRARPPRTSTTTRATTLPTTSAPGRDRARSSQPGWASGAPRTSVRVATSVSRSRRPAISGDSTSAVSAGTGDRERRRQLGVDRDGQRDEALDEPRPGPADDDVVGRPDRPALDRRHRAPAGPLGDDLGRRRRRPRRRGRSPPGRPRRASRAGC